MGTIMHQDSYYSSTILRESFSIMKYVIIQPYFGIFPVWMDLFLYSCSKNSQVDFVFYTDCAPSPAQSKYPNVTFYMTSFQDYCRMVSKRLGILFKPDNAYKLCDLKPFLGIVHREVIEPYDCWGYCDIDLVLGDLTILLDRMNEYDFISTHADRASGHFTMMKVNSKYTKACFKISGWKQKLTAQKHKCLDERDLTIVVARLMFYRDAFYNRYIRKQFPHLRDFFLRITSFLLRVLRDRRVYFHEYYTTPRPDFSSKFIYNTQSGRVFDVINGRELPYLHFLFFKKTPYWDNSDYWTDDSYMIPQGDSFSGTWNVEISKQGVFKV